MLSSYILLFSSHILYILYLINFLNIYSLLLYANEWVCI